MAYPITKFKFLLIITSSSFISMIYSSVFESSFDLFFICSIIIFQFYFIEFFLSLNVVPVSFYLIEPDFLVVFVSRISGFASPLSEMFLDDGTPRFSGDLSLGSLKITSCNDNLTFFNLSLILLCFYKPLILSLTPFRIEKRSFFF